VSDLSGARQQADIADVVDGGSHTTTVWQQIDSLWSCHRLAPGCRSVSVSGWKFGSRREVVLLATHVPIVLHCALEQLIAPVVELTAVLT
jgi:hypothetical protein